MMGLWIYPTIYRCHSPAEQIGGIGWVGVPRSTSSTRSVSAGGATSRPSSLRVTSAGGCRRRACSTIPQRPATPGCAAPAGCAQPSTPASRPPSTTAAHRPRRWIRSTAGCHTPHSGCASSAPEGLTILTAVPPADPIQHALARIALDAAVLLGTDQRHRLRVCASDTCSARFFDASRAASRRWCSMRGCGNTAKARRHRARSCK